MNWVVVLCCLLHLFLLFLFLPFSCSSSTFLSNPCSFWRHVSSPSLHLPLRLFDPQRYSNVGAGEFIASLPRQRFLLLLILSSFSWPDVQYRIVLMSYTCANKSPFLARFMVALCMYCSISNAHLFHHNDSSTAHVTWLPDDWPITVQFAVTGGRIEC